MKLNLFVLLIFASNSLFSQTGALPFTNFQQSPLLFGAGQIGAAIPNDDVLGYYFNPAILGYSARNNHASVSFMPDKTNWTIFSSRRTTFQNFGLNVGYNLNNTNLNLPISIGLGLISSKMDYGKFPITSWESPEIIKKTNSYDRFTVLSLGLSLDYYIRLSLGISIKSFDSKLGAHFMGSSIQEFTANGTMWDYGFLMTIPISKLLIKDNFNYKIDNTLSILSITNFSIGFSNSNIGDEVYYFDKSQSDPLSRTARLGYTFDFGVKLLTKKTDLNIFHYSFTAEAEDILIEYEDNFNGYKYQSAIGDINLRDHLFFLIGDKNVVVHKGHILKFFDSLILTSGSFDGKGYKPAKTTNGLGYSSEGIFKLLNSISENEVLDYITKHFLIEYFDTNYDIFIGQTINFDILSLHFRGFEF